MDLKKIIEEIIDYTGTISITETEWYWNIESVRKPNKVADKEITWEEFDIARKEEILYDIVFRDLASLEQQVENDLCSYGEHSNEHDYIVKFCKKMKSYFPNFNVEGVC